jgi:hypothetical protein
MEEVTNTASSTGAMIICLIIVIGVTLLIERKD